MLFQNRIRHDIGFDYSLGVAYRPFLINNLTLTFGASALQTGRGFRDIFTDASRNCPPGVGDFCQPDVISPKKPLYSLFAASEVCVLETRSAHRGREAMNPHINELTHEIIGGSYRSSSRAWPGLLESSYQECLCHELLLRGVDFRREYPLPLYYKGIYGWTADTE